MKENVTPQNQQHSSNSLLIYSSIGIFVLIVVIAVTYLSFNGPQNTTTPTSTESKTVVVTENSLNTPKETDQDDTTSTTQSSTVSSTTPTQNPSQEPTTQSSVYKDGTYTQTGSYISPGGQESIQVTLTIKQDNIDKVIVGNQATNRQSQEYVDLFIKGIDQQVVGKKIESVDVSRINGASLTGKGFNLALDKIKEEAKISS